MTRLLAVLLCVAVFTPCVDAKSPYRRGEVETKRPQLNGTKASAAIPVKYHLRNESGTDEAGLCVPTSVLMAGMTVGIPGLDKPGIDEASGKMVPGKGSALWRDSKSHPGGSYPEKLEAQLKRVMPDSKWVNYVGDDPSGIEQFTSKGIPVASQMNTGALYNYQPIHHYIDVNHYESKPNGLTCIVDNNEPGIFQWMKTEEYNRRAVDGGVVWYFAWIPPKLRSGSSPLLLLAAALCIAGSGLLLLFRSPRFTWALP